MKPDKITDAEALRRQEAFNFALFQHNPAPITVVDRDGCTVKSNLARRKSGDGVPPLGEPLFAAGASGSGTDLQEELSDSIRSGGEKRFIEERVGESYFDITVAPLSDGAIVISEDVTERVRMRDEAREQQEQLIQAQKMASLGTLVSGVAHEVSNPNNIMLLTASLLRKTLEDVLPALDEHHATNSGFQVCGRPYDEMRGEMMEQVDVVSRAADRIEHLVRDLKDYARKDEADLASMVDVNQMVGNAVTLLGTMIKRATGHFSVEYHESLPPVAGNARRLEQVVINLISNACQALGGKERAVAVSTAYDSGAGKVTITVRDEGCGIPADALARIKDPFFTTRHDEGGTGLGLSVSDKIVIAHGGTLTFISVPAEGTTAVIELPRASGEGGAEKP